jgi:hypothetical protein
MLKVTKKFRIILNFLIGFTTLLNRHLSGTMEKAVKGPVLSPGTVFGANNRPVSTRLHSHPGICPRIWVGGVTVLI